MGGHLTVVEPVLKPETVEVTSFDPGLSRLLEDDLSALRLEFGEAKAVHLLFVYPMNTVLANLVVLGFLKYLMV